MPKLIVTPAVIEAAGNKPKKIEEFIIFPDDRRLPGGRNNAGAGCDRRI